MFKIGALAQKTRCRVETIRFYERRGLMPDPDRTESGHRIYGREHERRLRFIRRSRQLDFTLDEITALLRFLDQDEYSCEKVQAFAETHVGKIRSRIAELRQMEKALVRLAERCEADRSPNCPLLEQLFND